MAWLGREGVVYVCGEWEHGQLGLPLARDFRDPTSIDPPPAPFQTPVPSTGVRINDKGEELHPLPAVDGDEHVCYPVIVPALRDHQVTTVAAGGDHSMAVTSAGRVFAFGRNDSYQLGVALNANSQFLAGGARIGVDKLLQEGADERQVGPEPVQVAGLRWKSVLEISCGDGHNLARCVDGSVYAWGLGGSGRLGLGHHKSVMQPAKVDLGEDKFCIAVAAGYYHSMALIEGGELLAWGSGDCGQLGTGIFNSEVRPRAVKPLAAGHSCASIAAGEYHSVAVSERGGAFTWGLNNAGQLGTGDTDRRNVPTNPSALVAVKVRRIACGASFTIAICDSTEVLGWGGNDCGCLGLGDTSPRLEPTAIVALRGQAIEQVSCGGRFVGALDEQGKLWVWGANGHGNLCLGDSKDRYAPIAVEGSLELELSTVACGYNHMVLASKLEPAEVQSRMFYQQGLVHMDDALIDTFCLYHWTRSARYYPQSVAKAFFDRHGVAMAADTIVTVSVADDRRLQEVVERLQCVASKGQSALEKCRLLAVGVYYEMGGAQRALNDISARHVGQVLERAQITSGLLPLGMIRIGDSRHRATLFKLVCDRLAIPCCLLRGALPEVDSSQGFFDLSLCSPDPMAYRSFHHWNLVGGQKACSALRGRPAFAPRRPLASLYPYLA